MKKKTTKKLKPEGEPYYLTDDETVLIMEALKNHEKKIREEKFYRHDHPDLFYEVFLERLWKIMNKIDRPIRIIKGVKFPNF